MENAIQSFTNTEFGELEILQEGDKFWFPASKCATLLGYTNPRKAIIDHCRGDGVTNRYGVSQTTNQHGVTTNQVNEMKYITEGNLYRLICRSKLPAALAFETWVFDEVLPAIRQNGVYQLKGQMEDLKNSLSESAKILATLSDNLISEQEHRIKLEDNNRQLTEITQSLRATVEITQPKAAYYDLILENPDAVPVTLIAKDYGYSAVKFNALLHEYKIQFAVGGTWELYQEYADLGYTHNNVHYTKTGHNKVHMCWTQKGRLFLYDFLKKEGILPKIEQPRQEVMR